MRSGLDQQLLTRALSDASGMKVSFDSYALSLGGTASLDRLKVQFADQEFLTAEGKTIALLTLDETDVRPMGGSEILHVREFTPV